jgi:hypothetical protein
MTACCGEDAGLHGSQRPGGRWPLDHQRWHRRPFWPTWASSWKNRRMRLSARRLPSGRRGAPFLEAFLCLRLPFRVNRAGLLPRHPHTTQQPPDTVGGALSCRNGRHSTLPGPHRSRCRRLGLRPAVIAAASTTLPFSKTEVERHGVAASGAGDDGAGHRVNDPLPDLRQRERRGRPRRG